jgi:maltodextrin utilization protein YvdJ
MPFHFYFCGPLVLPILPLEESLFLFLVITVIFFLALELVLLGLVALMSTMTKLSTVVAIHAVEPPELFQLKCLSHASGAATHLNRNNPSVPHI